jgi:uridine phosphorylase
LVHIHQTTELAPRVLLPGDPGRALRIAQELLEQPKMLNHNRGLWGYTGTAPDGELLSIQSTGIGAPSAAIVTTELIELGARRLVRVGTCRGLDPGLELGQLLVASEALADDGTSRALGGLEPLARVQGSTGLTAALQVSGVASGITVSSDLFYDSDDRVLAGSAAGAQVADMATAAIFTIAARHGVEAGCALLVASVGPSGARIEPDALHAAELELGRLAIAALSL